jgi:peptidoglycan hydrolase-like protein with peptidoglycan-binding domain
MQFLLSLLNLLLGRKVDRAPAPGPAAPRQPTAFSLATADDVRAVQAVLAECGYLDPPPDGGFGPVSKWALAEFCKRAGVACTLDTITPIMSGALNAAKPLPLNPGNDPRSEPGAGLAGRIIRAMQANGYWIARHPDCLNIVYVEGMDPDGTPNANRPNEFNDLRTVIRVGADGVPKIIGKWEATTEPSRRWTRDPMNPAGAARIKFGQYKAWALGTHHTHEALVQVAPITVCRDANKDYKRDGDKEDTGLFGVNQHWGYDLPRNDLGTSSAGCLVGRSTAGHREFMGIVKGDARFRVNPAYRFITTVMPAAWVRP